MRRILRAYILGFLALALVVFPALAQDQALNLEKFVGTYEFEAPDFGLIGILVALSEDGATITLAAMDAPPISLLHLTGNTFEGESPEFGVITFGFVEDEDGAVTMMTIDGYDFSFIAEKKS